MSTENLEKGKWYLQNVVGVSEQDVASLAGNPHSRALLEKFPEMTSYELVATVVDNPGPVYCSAQLKAGQQFVFDLMPAMLNIQQSSCPLCTRAIAPIAKVVPQFWGAIVSGSDPASMRVGCDDQGIAAGGLGHVEFEVSIKKK
jgi:uncharacterized repeat protein (TIGR04076 family)